MSFLLYNVGILFIFILVFILSYIFITIDQNLHGGDNPIVFKFDLDFFMVFSNSGWFIRSISDEFVWKKSYHNFMEDSIIRTKLSNIFFYFSNVD